MQHFLKEYIFPMLVCVLGALLGSLTSCNSNGCDCVGVGTVAAPSQPYQGAANATLPYIDVGKVNVGQQSCQGNVCTYGAGLHPWIHNPVATAIKVHKISCNYYIGEVLSGTSETKWDAEVPARSSRRLTGFDYLFDVLVGNPTGIGVRCTADFGSDFPTSTDDAD